MKWNQGSEWQGQLVELAALDAACYSVLWACCLEMHTDGVLRFLFLVSINMQMRVTAATSFRQYIKIS